MDKIQELLILIRSYLTYDANGIPSVNSTDPALVEASENINTTLGDIYTETQSINELTNGIEGSTSATKTAVESIDGKLDTTNTNTANSYSELQNIHTRQNNGTQKTQVIPTASPTALVLTESAVVASGSTAADNLYMTFVTSEDFAGSINGITIPKLSVKEYPYLPGYKYPSISYTRTAGTLYIIQAK